MTRGMSGLSAVVLPSASVLLAAAVVLLAAASLHALDSVRKAGGQSVSGTVQAAAKDEVRIDKTVGGSETIPINEVEYIIYDGEPANLRLVRTAVANGAFANAIATLDKIDVATATKPEHKSEMEFYRAYCLARLALGGSGKINEAWDREFLDRFLGQNRDAMLSYSNAETLRDGGQGGFEIRTFIAVAAAAKGQGKLHYYAPIPIYAVGCTVAEMEIV